MLGHGARCGCFARRPSKTLKAKVDLCPQSCLEPGRRCTRRRGLRDEADECQWRPGSGNRRREEVYHEADWRGQWRGARRIAREENEKFHTIFLLQA
ncbi:hypothetical protein BRADI_1g34712v3 [Brachypodium distachyon]|uniref:Uncharacterized protein n=1 Tax=Brachypodium distachyon TaxID=15368 RepID=A0A2K2DMQ4_BRADI|nr:hypothetical protein BRADI_1g34712v3 [Brachypodium distachyon]